MPRPRAWPWLAAAGIFLLCAALYFLTRSPALDEWDSVQFALGATRGFNLFQHQPHPPGYPLYVGFGWLGQRLGLDVCSALELGSALGGGLFVASWFVLAARAAADRRLAVALAAALAVLPITWMTATKALTDAPAAGLLAFQLLGAAVFRERRAPGALAWVALAGAAAAGVRPQNFGIAALILVLALAGGGAGRRRWAAGFGLFLAGCLAWLLPTMLLQARWPEAGGSILAYPRLLWAQWTWRLDQPKAFLGATGQTGEGLALRLWLHFAGWFTRGFAFAENLALGVVGFALLAGGWFLCWKARPGGVSALLRGSVPWAAAYIVMIFCCLPPDQRYYLPVFPLLLLPALAGWLSLPGRAAPWLAAGLPALLLALALPLARENHAEPAPPVRLIRWLEGQHPADERSAVWLVFRDSRQHAQWYGPGFRVEWSQYFPPPARWPEEWKTARAIYTDDPAIAAAAPPAPGWAWRTVGEWHRSPLIYRKHNAVTLWRLEAPDASGG